MGQKRRQLNQSRGRS